MNLKEVGAGTDMPAEKSYLVSDGSAAEISAHVTGSARWSSVNVKKRVLKMVKSGLGLSTVAGENVRDPAAVLE